MSGFTHSPTSQGNKTLSIGDSKPLRCKGAFFWVTCIYLYQNIRKNCIDIQSDYDK